MGALVQELRTARMEAARVEQQKKSNVQENGAGWIDGLLSSLGELLSGGNTARGNNGAARTVRMKSPEKPSGPLRLHDLKKGTLPKYTPLETLIAKGERALGEMEAEQRSTPEGATMLHDLAVLLHEDGDRLDEAKALLGEALALRRSTFGDKHSATLETLHALASVDLDQDALTSAHEHFAATSSGRREVLGASHPDTLASVSGFAAVLQAQGALEEAAGLHSEALSGRREQLHAAEAAAKDEAATDTGAGPSDAMLTATVAFLEAATSLASVKLSLGELDAASTTLAEAMPAARQLGGSHRAIQSYAEQVRRCKALRAAEKAKDGGLLGDIFAFSQPAGQGPKLSHRGEGPRKVLGRVAANAK